LWCSLAAGEKTVHQIAESFADIPPGEPALIVGSAMTVEVAANRESAAVLLGIVAGMPVRLIPPGS
jgi:S-adenosylmethionine hydrolase